MKIKPEDANYWLRISLGKNKMSVLGEKGLRVQERNL